MGESWISVEQLFPNAPLRCGHEWQHSIWPIPRNPWLTTGQDWSYQKALTRSRTYGGERFGYSGSPEDHFTPACLGAISDWGGAVGSKIHFDAPARTER